MNNDGILPLEPKWYFAINRENILNKKNNNLKSTPKFIIETDQVAPRTKLEEKLCNIFQEILGIKIVGINDDFFCIGEGLTTLNQFTAACQRELDIYIPCDLLNN